VGITESGPCCIVQPCVSFLTCHCKYKENMVVLCVCVCVCVCLSLCVAVFMFAFMSVNVYLSLNRKHGCLINKSSSPSSLSVLSLRLSFFYLSESLSFFLWACFLFKLAQPQTSQIDLRYQSGESAMRRRDPLGPYCPPTHQCSGQRGTVGGSLHCSHLLQPLGPQLQTYSGRALILKTSTERKRLIKMARKWKTTSSNWHSLIQINHLKHTRLIKPVSFLHPTLNLHCEINSTPPYQ